MLISTDWIKDFVNLPEISPTELGIKFTLATAEVEDVVVIGDFFEKLKVAEVIKVEKHPEADKLSLATFKISETDSKTVVCGAPNVKVGLKVPYAPIGVTLPNGLTLEPKKIRGILSEGMLCSEEELGYTDHSDGILELPANAPVGQDMLTYLKETKDVLLDIDNKSLTHRPDLWGHFGMAREFATVFEQKLKNPFTDTWKKNLEKKYTSDKSPITPILEGESAGLGYIGLSVDNIKISESPSWMQKRLRAVGLRPINNIVDIGNFVMLELGIPLHIFDRNQLKGNKIVIHRLKENTKFVTLDEQERNLLAGDTIISDSEKPLVVAGIMGGLSSGVTDSTNQIFIEVANWKAAEIRKTSNRLGLRTDSSQRYEKTLDTSMLERTLLRALELVLELCPEAKVIGKPQYDGIDISKIPTLHIDTSTSKICKVLGAEVPTDRIVKILTSLDYKVTENNGNLKVKVPSYRATKDIEYEEDIFEEIGRIIGYDNIEPIPPTFKAEPANLSTAQVMSRKIRDFLSLSAGCYEIYSYPLVSKKLLEKAAWPEESSFTLINPTTEEADRMRPSLVPQILDIVAKNQKNYTDFKLFEVGRVYKTDKKNFSKDVTQVSIAFFNKSENVFLSLTNSVQKLLSNLSLPAELFEKDKKFKNSLIPEDWNGTHPFELLNIKIMGKIDGVIASIHPVMLKKFKIKGNLSVAIIDISRAEGMKLKDKTKYTPLPKFPGSSFDCTVVAPIDKPIGEVYKALKKLKMKEISETTVVGVYTMNDNEKSVTLRVNFLDNEKTLTGDFLKNAEGSVIETLNKAGFPLKS